MRTLRLFLICLGGAIGTGARYLTSLWAISRFGSAFPAGTLIVNVTGSFLVSAVMYVALATNSMSDDVRLMLTAGVLGGFTTYSAFNYETTMFLRDGAWTMAMLNLFATVLGCLAAGVAGFAIARLIVGR